MRRALAALSLLLLLGCSRTPTANPLPGPVPSASASVAPSASQSARALPPLLGEGCHAGIPLDEKSLERVQAACFPDAVALRKASDETAPGQLPVHVEDPSACLRIAGVGPASSNVELVLREATGAELARDVLPGGIALIGPVCVASAGEYRLDIGSSGSSGSVRVGVWRAK